MVKGIVMETEPESATKIANDCKVVVFTCSVDATQTETKGTVVLNDAKQLLNYNKSEEEHIHQVIKGLYEMGVRVIITGETIGEMALHFIDKYKMVALIVVSKWTLRRLCRSLNARPCVQLTEVRHEDLGNVASARIEEIGSQTITVFEQVKSKESPVSTIVIRGATHPLLQDVERAIDDGVNIVRAMTRNGKFVAGAGAVEIEIARRVAKYATEVEGLEQYAIQQYAQAFEVVPRTLAENAGLNDTDLLTKLYKAHEEITPDSHKYGIDITDGSVKDMTKEGVIDLMATRQMGIKLASQAAITILRVDHIIMKKPSGGPKPQNRGHWDDNDETW
jgi:T-complex protein 1 subunit theta